MISQDFGVYIKELRRRRKLTIRQLDQRSGVSHSYISQMERGERGIPSPDILMKLSKPLGIEYEELMIVAGHLKREQKESFLTDPEKLELYEVIEKSSKETKLILIDVARRLNQKES